MIKAITVALLLIVYNYLFCLPVMSVIFKVGFLEALVLCRLGSSPEECFTSWNDLVSDLKRTLLRLHSAVIFLHVLFMARNKFLVI